MAESATRSLGWLHLTDLHIGQPREGGRLANIEREFVADLEKVVKQTQRPIRIVFFSGDIAFRGSDGEYVRATAMLGRICNHIRRLNKAISGSEDPTPVLVPVPGNHDLARPSKADAETIRTAFASRTAASPALWEPGQLGVEELIQTCFAGYSGWLRHHPLPFPPGMQQGLLPGDLRATVDRDGLRVGVLGLNTSYLHLGDETPGTLHLDLSQVTRLLGSNTRAWVESHDFCVLVTHHPPNWLSDASRTTLDQEIKPDALFDLHLFGHEHLGSHRQDPGSSGIRHLIEGRSLFGAEESGSPRIHGYVVGEFRLQAQGAKTERSTRVFVRQGWRDGHGWRFGPGDARWGSWHLHIDLGEAPSRDRQDNAPSAQWPSHAEGRAAPRLHPNLGDASQVGRGRWNRIEDAAELEQLLREYGSDRKWILLSASVPRHVEDRARRERERKYVESAKPEAILAFVRALARHANEPENRLGIVFGGHPSITQAISPIVMQPTKRSADAPERPVEERCRLVLVQDEHFWPSVVEDVSVLACIPQVLPILMPTRGTGPDLDRMRALMTRPESIVAAVFVGGMSGVREEFALVGKLRPDMPRYCVGVGGGAAAELLLDGNCSEMAKGVTQSSVLGRLRVQNSARLWHTPKSAVEAIVEALAPITHPR